MSDEQPPPPLPPQSQRPPVPSSQLFPTWRQALVMLGGGLALATSACFGFVFTVDLAPREGSVLAFFGTFLMVLVPVGLVGTLVGGVLVLMRVLHVMFGKKDDTGTNSGGA
jgi:hypothetical protein